MKRTLGIEKSSEPASGAAPARLEHSLTGLRRTAEAAAKAAAVGPRLPRRQWRPRRALLSERPGAAASARSARSASAAARPRARRPLPIRSHELYRRAHQAHFTEHDPARALGLWEAYLREAPRGRFAVEARYNRALCLVRLGRHAEARAALEPFAKGAVGSYRQHEAAELLEALGN